MPHTTGRDTEFDIQHQTRPVFGDRSHVISERVFRDAKAGWAANMHQPIFAIIRQNVFLRLRFQNRELMLQSPQSVALSNIDMRTAAGINISQLEKELQTPPILQVKMEDFLGGAYQHPVIAFLGRRKTPP